MEKMTIEKTDDKIATCELKDLSSNQIIPWEKNQNEFFVPDTRLNSDLEAISARSGAIRPLIPAA